MWMWAAPSRSGDWSVLQTKLNLFTDQSIDCLSIPTRITPYFQCRTMSVSLFGIFNRNISRGILGARHAEHRSV